MGRLAVFLVALLACTRGGFGDTKTGDKFLASLTCYSCQFTYSNSAHDNAPGASDPTEDAWCANATLLKVKPAVVIRPCASWESYCTVKTTITTTLHSFTTIKRECSEACAVWCESQGYGPNTVSCTDCCTTNNCNSNYSVAYYKSVMQRSDMSWVKALRGEIKFNRQANITFPY